VNSSSVTSVIVFGFSIVIGPRRTLTFPSSCRLISRAKPSTRSIQIPYQFRSLQPWGLRATQEQLQDALGGCQALNPVYRRLIKMVLDEVASIDKRIEQLNQEMANLLRPHENQVKRLAEVPGLGVDAAQQIIAEVGVTAAPSRNRIS
jgi:transposase